MFQDPFDVDSNAGYARGVFSVTQTTSYIKSLFDSDSLLLDISVQGEISNFKHYPSGHMYFTLKDKDSKLKMVMFSYANRKLNFVPKDGLHVTARGSISVYERDGQYQMIVTSMQEAGFGQLFLQLQALKNKLQAEGLFSDSNKKPLPKFPRVIGVITSPAGAVLRDIITTLRRRYPIARILLYPAQVQGAEAPESIVEAIDQMNRLAEADVLIVGRGGGSLEELWAFQDESVVRAIYRSSIPVISAVGHQTDVTLADFVADQRAPTPTAAAELASPNQVELASHLEHLQIRLGRALRQRATKAQEALNRLQRTPWLIQPHRELQQPVQTLDYLSQRLRQVMRSALSEQRSMLEGRIAHLDSLSPLKVMSRGFSLVYDAHRESLVRSATELSAGNSLLVRFADGQAGCQVTDVVVSSVGPPNSKTD